MVCDLSVWSEAVEAATSISFPSGSLLYLAKGLPGDSQTTFSTTLLCVKPLAGAFSALNLGFQVTPFFWGQPLPYITGEEISIPEII